MAPDTVDRGFRLRLAYLRHRRGAHAFMTDDNTTGQDRTGSVTLEVDASGWVVTSRVARLDGLRHAAAFVAAVEEAYRAAAAVRMAANAQVRRRDRPLTPEEMERGLEVAEGRRRLEPPPRPHFPRWQLPTAPVADRPTLPPPDPGARVVTGVSRRGEISVSATVMAGLAGVRADQDWLTGTSLELAHYALREAFEDLREKGAR